MRYIFTQKLLWILIVSIGFVGGAASQTSADRTLTLIVPNLPGGSSDLIARGLAAKLQSLFGRTVIVENKPGASEMIATEILARSPPDGNTIAIFSNALAINETMSTNRRYDAVRDLIPVARIAELPFALIVSSSVPAQNLLEFVDFVKRNPSKLSYGHVGVGAPHFLTMEWFKSVAHIELLAVPYKSSPPVFTGLLGGEIQVTIGALGGATQFIQSGQVRALAAMSKRRPLLAPNLPTVAEAGYPEFDLVPWMGIFVPAGTPNNIVEHLEREILAAASSADFREQMGRVGLEPATAGSKEFAAIVQHDIKNWSNVIATVGLKPQ